jgi:hypothetical protein
MQEQNIGDRYQEGEGPSPEWGCFVSPAGELGWGEDSSEPLEPHSLQPAGAGQ